MVYVNLCVCVNMGFMSVTHKLLFLSKSPKFYHYWKNTNRGHQDLILGELLLEAEVLVA